MLPLLVAEMPCVPTMGLPLVDSVPVALTPGMTATVEIHTGNRRVIDYVLSPIAETTSTAGHER